MYVTRPGLHWTRCNGRIVFLDVPADRYFCLPPPLERAFLDAIHLQDEEGGRAAELLAGGLLIRCASPMPAEPMPRSQVKESLLDAPGGARAPCGADASWRDAGAVAAALAWARLRHKRWSLEASLSKVTQSRPEAETPGDRDLVMARAARFLRLRPLFPAKRLCLPDSLALIHYLGSPKTVRLVIGVTMDPFAAHCWVEAGDTLLNDRVDHVRCFSPILVV